jgi:hypothetical protein
VEKDIRDMAEEFWKRSLANGKIVFGLGHTKKLTGVMHWVQDCNRVNDVPDHNDFNVEEVLYQSLSLAQIRTSDMNLLATNSKAADPGKIKDERKWPEWERPLSTTWLSFPALAAYPLSFVVREAEDPENHLLLNNRIGKAFI